ncbi:RlpA-like double-psi beta-barrel-protein domain-containing protein-containing protein [Gautieria morchelliformis]|nr:RlpA-like double-psi beta-barrel-protein domain-containing protein-containing protein [Gautieria morchelliformis]
MFTFIVAAFLAFIVLANSAPVARSGHQSGLMRLALTHSDDLTFFPPSLGACGKINVASDLMVAVSFDGPQMNGNLVCGRKVQATAPGGKTVTVSVEDKCASCTQFDLDMSPAAFDQLADESVG